MRRRLPAFVRGAWHIVEPSEEYRHNWHIDALCQHLEALTDGRIDSLLGNVPPGMMKSLLFNVFWPAWVWATDPAKRFMFTSYAESLAMRDSVKCRALIQSDWYQSRWPLKMSADDNTKGKFQNAKGGWRLVASIGGKGIGEHPDFNCFDDPHNVKQSESEAERQAVIDWLGGTFSTRGLARGVRRAGIMQRLHENDASDHLLKQGGWTHICLPMRYEPGRMPDTPLGWNDPRTEPGELLWPEVYTEKIVAKLEGEMGSFRAAGQLQQRPAPAGGCIFKTDHWKRMKLLPRETAKIISVDAAFKGNANSDYVAIGVLGALGPKRFIHYVRNQRMGFGATVQAIKDVRAMFPDVLAVVIEDKANGPAIKNTLEKHMTGVQEYSPRGSKLARAQAYQPMVEAGDCYLPEDEPWVEPLIAEFSAFTGKPGGIDNRVDMWSQGMDWFELHTLGTEEIEHEARAERAVW